jgi:hypothetical protein
MCAGGHEAQRRSFRQERGADHKGKFGAAALHSAAQLTLAMLARGGQQTAMQIGSILQRAWSNKGRLHNSPSSIQVGYFFGGCKKPDEQEAVRFWSIWPRGRCLVRLRPA